MSLFPDGRVPSVCTTSEKSGKEVFPGFRRSHMSLDLMGLRDVGLILGGGGAHILCRYL